jgi:hypothetical protein
MSGKNAVKKHDAVPASNPDTAELTKRRDEALARKKQFESQLQQLQQMAQQLVGQINKVSGEIEAYDGLIGESNV